MHEIAALLLTERIQPTVEAIREVNNGRGSPNTIHPGLKSFYESGECERRMVRVVHADNVPARVVELWDELQALAKAAGEAQVRAQTDALADEASVLKMQWAALDKEQQIIRDRLEVAAQIEAELRARIVTLEASERHSREAAATHRNLFEAQQESLSAREREIAELRAALATRDQAIALAEQRNEADQAAHERDIVHMETRISELQQQLAQADMIHQDLNQQLVDARAAQEAVRGRADGYLQDLTAARIDLSDVRRQLEALPAIVSDRDSLRTRTEALSAEVVELKALLERRSSDITQHLRRIGSLEGELRGLTMLVPELERSREEIERLRRSTDLLRQPPAVMVRLEKIEALLERALAERGSRRSGTDVPDSDA